MAGLHYFPLKWLSSTTLWKCSCIFSHPSLKHCLQRCLCNKTCFPWKAFQGTWTLLHTEVWACLPSCSSKFERAKVSVLSSVVCLDCQCGVPPATVTCWILHSRLASFPEETNLKRCTTSVWNARRSLAMWQCPKGIKKGGTLWRSS